MSAAEISKQIRAQKDLIKLAQAVVDWWQEAQYSVYAIHGEEYNAYDQPPEFVKLAEKTLKENKP